MTDDKYDEMDWYQLGDEQKNVGMKKGPKERIERMKIKLLEVVHGDCYSCGNEHLLQVTDWEEVTDSEFEKLREGLGLYKRYKYGKLPYRNLILVQQLDLPTAREIISTVDETIKKEQEKTRKKKAAANKRKKTMLENKKKKELEELERLQKKYG